MEPLCCNTKINTNTIMMYQYCHSVYFYIINGNYSLCITVVKTGGRIVLICHWYYNVENGSKFLKVILLILGLKSGVVRFSHVYYGINVYLHRCEKYSKCVNIRFYFPTSSSVLF